MPHYFVVACVKDGILSGYGYTLGMQVLCLQGNLGLQCLAECISRFDDGVAAQGALGVDVGIPQQRLGDIGHKGISITELIKPVDAVGVYGSAKVYEYSLNHPCVQFS